jgi:mannose-6-phosphate isomerase-like protein (cupin superfamily)
MEAFDLQGLRDRRAERGGPWLEFVRSADLSAGIYELAAGAADPQSPHTEDELYHVVRGRAMLRVGDEDRTVGPGSLVFVAAGVPHRFHDIGEDLTILVVFGPAERSRATAAATSG